MTCSIQIFPKAKCVVTWSVRSMATKASKHFCILFTIPLITVVGKHSKNPHSSVPWGLLQKNPEEWIEPQYWPRSISLQHPSHLKLNWCNGPLLCMACMSSSNQCCIFTASIIFIILIAFIFICIGN